MMKHLGKVTPASALLELERVSWRICDKPRVPSPQLKNGVNYISSCFPAKLLAYTNEVVGLLAKAFLSMCILDDFLHTTTR